jgi:hypothetical protein
LTCRLPSVPLAWQSLKAQDTDLMADLQRFSLASPSSTIKVS